jgi:hypothetical protein
MDLQFPCDAFARLFDRPSPEIIMEFDDEAQRHYVCVERHGQPRSRTLSEFASHFLDTLHERFRLGLGVAAPVVHILQRVDKLTHDTSNRAVLSASSHVQLHGAP